MKPKCKLASCTGRYEIEDETESGEILFCCSNPTCTSKVDHRTLIFRYFIDNGVNVYQWKRKCWNCSTITPIYSYFILYELEKLDPFFSGCHGIGLGDVRFLDDIVIKKKTSVTIKRDREMRQYYAVNNCIKCGFKQGKNYVVDDPHEIWNDLNERLMEKKHSAFNIPISGRDKKFINELILVLENNYGFEF